MPRSIPRIGRCIVLILLISSAFFNQSAQALPPADYYLMVDTTDDDPTLSACTGVDDDCSLRGAISTANAAPGGSVIYITIPAGEYYCTRPGDNENNNQTGDLDIKNNTITLHGAGMDQTILDGQMQDRVLDNRSPNLTVEHLKITQGVAPSNDQGGGGILNRGGATLHLKDVLIQGNSADGMLEYLDGGGGITNIGSMLIETSSIIENDACKGGGILLCSATTTVRDSLIDDNIAIDETNCGSGGGISMYNGDVQTMIVNTVINGNHGVRGGGMFYNGQHGYIIDSSFSNNETSSTAGGLMNYGVLSLSRSIFSGNSTNFSGGGLYSNGTTQLQNITFYANHARSGGGIALFTSGTTSIDHITLAGNWVSEDGAAIFTTGVGTLELHNSIFTSNDAGNTCSIAVGNVVNNLGYNLSSDDSCGFGTATHDLVNHDPLLGSLGNDGGITDTLPLLTGSPAIDTADPVTSQAKDQRSWYRPVDGNGNGISTADIGAYEYASFTLPPLGWLPLIIKSP